MGGHHAFWEKRDAVTRRHRCGKQVKASGSYRITKLSTVTRVSSDGEKRR